MTAILEIDHLCKSYGSVEVLRDISVSIEKGEFLVLLGPSGCGKSTLLNCIAGLEEITDGALMIEGRHMNDVPPKDRDIAMVFQSYALYPNMTVAENITFGMKVRNVDPALRESKTFAVAKLLQIEALLDRKPSQLSGGQRQRIAMGRALVRDPMLFLFDEPLSNLDAKLRVEMRAEIRRVHRTLGSSIVYVTHDQIEALTMATKIVVLNDGVIQQVGTPAEIYNQPSNVFVADFMGAPAMNLIPALAVANENGVSIKIERKEGAPLLLHDRRENSGLHAAETPVILGLRPENITDAGGQGGKCLVNSIEGTGSDLFVVTELGGIAATARLRADAMVQVGDMAELDFDMSKASYFSPDTGERIV